MFTCSEVGSAATQEICIFYLFSLALPVFLLVFCVYTGLKYICLSLRVSMILDQFGFMVEQFVKMLQMKGYSKKPTISKMSLIRVLCSLVSIVTHATVSAQCLCECVNAFGCISVLTMQHFLLQDSHQMMGRRMMKTAIVNLQTVLKTRSAPN